MSAQGNRVLYFAYGMGLILVACRLPSLGMMGQDGMMEGRRGEMPGPRGVGESVPTPEVTAAPTVTPGGSVEVSYKQQIQPILNRKCVGCHGGQAGLFMDSYDNLMSGSRGGKIVIPGDPEGSELVRRITGVSRPRMPPGGPALEPSEIELLMAWIADGCPNN